MATAKKLAELPGPEVVKLKCDDLGIESQDFTPEHAEALLKFQTEKGYTHWQPVDTAEAAKLEA